MADKGFPLAAPSGPSQTACIAASHREGVGSPTAVEWRGQEQVDDRRSDAPGVGLQTFDFVEYFLGISAVGRPWPCAGPETQVVLDTLGSAPCIVGVQDGHGTSVDAGGGTQMGDALGDAGPVAACLRHAEESFNRFQKEFKIINKGLRAVHVAHRNRDKLAFETSKEAFTLLLAELHTDSAREVWLEAIKGLDRLEAPD